MRAALFALAFSQVLVSPPASARLPDDPPVNPVGLEIHCRSDRQLKKRALELDSISLVARDDESYDIETGTLVLRFTFRFLRCMSSQDDSGRLRYYWESLPDRDPHSNLIPSYRSPFSYALLSYDFRSRKKYKTERRFGNDPHSGILIERKEEVAHPPYVPLPYTMVTMTVPYQSLLTRYEQEQLATNGSVGKAIELYVTPAFQAKFATGGVRIDLNLRKGADGRILPEIFFIGEGFSPEK